ncbi:sigma factor [Streptomyces niveus]|uniref:sigma factor n=1 Tax=Streptomyces niveus TaxID=193462 RepID=UPI0036EC5017
MRTQTGGQAAAGRPLIEDAGNIAPKDAKALSKLFFDRLGVLEEGTPEFQYARNTLIEMNLSLVKFAARRFRNLGNGEMEEILQVGTIGLIKAIDRFDLSRESSSAPLNERRPDYAALGHTIDYRLRLRLGSGPGPAAIAGVELIGGDLPVEGAPAPAVRANLHMIGTNVLDRLHAHLVNPSRRLDDITEQMNLAEEPFAPLRDLPADQRVYGPVFAGSADVKADADFITDGFLIDCKALTRPHRVGREEVQQLAWYLLLDYDDRYDIREGGFYLARQGALIRRTVPAFLTALGANLTLPQLRSALRDHLRLKRPA